MKTLTLGLLLLGFAGSLLAADKVQLDNRIRTLTGKLEELQAKPDKCVPAENLRNARGVILMERTKAGLVFGYQGGGGVALVKDPKTEKWSPVAFMSAHEGSFGAQIGGEHTFFVILLMSTNATQLLLESKVDFGGEARGTAGDSTAVKEGKSISPDPTVLVYNDRKGLYGGATIKGGSVSPNDEDNRTYYQQSLTTKEILFENKIEPTEAAKALASKLTEYSQSSKK
jgi:lipid-binding SYLF domain-containing protein